MLVKKAIKLRKLIMPFLRPKGKYFFATKNLSPISTVYGLDRGTPIDRFWIDRFMDENWKYIKGRVLEIGDNRYSESYKENISKLDILDIDKKNGLANIHGDLRDLRDKVKSNTYDCIILTQVLGMIDDLQSTVSEIERILKPRGVILVTASSLSPVYNEEQSFWRFTKSSLKYLFKNGFDVKVESYGNVLAGQYFWVGLSQEEMSEKELLFNDKRYPCVISLVGIKKQV